MFSTATRISVLTLAFGLTAAISSAHAQSSDSSLINASGGQNNEAPANDSMKFNTDSAPANNDRHPMKFADPGDTPLGQKSASAPDAPPEETPFKTYIGYPKNQLSVYASELFLSSKWTYNGQDFNFNNSPLAIGADYRLVVTPMWKVDLDYQHYSMSVPAGTVYPYNVISSSQNFDTYYIKGRYCFLGSSTFYRQLCPGIDIGNDAYPILKFAGTQTNLELGEVQDITLGVNLTYQQPFGENYLFQVGVGYNYGTGLGNSGSLTSKNNSSYFIKADVDYNITEHNTIFVEAGYMARTAKLSGLAGANTVTWETDSTVMNVKLGYTRTF